MVAEKILIEGLKKGREEAYISLMEQYGSKLLQTCCLILNDRQEAEDIVQETFLRVFRSIKDFRGDSSIYTWLYRIAVNLARDKIRGNIANLKLEEELIGDEYTEDTVVSNLDREAVRIGLYSIVALYREALVLFYFRDFSIAEIAELLNEKEGTIKSRLSRGRKILSQSLVKGGALDG